MMLNLDTLGLAATVTASGISAPDYQTILNTLTGYFQQIYGDDVYLESDSKDGQMLAIYALGIHDANNMAIAVYNSFSPATAQGRGLASNVKINGIAVTPASRSTADVRIVGQVGTLISNGTVRDSNGITWSLPASVVIGIDGAVTVTATCQIDGAVVAPAGSITEIGTPTRGWQSVTNPTAATAGRKVETDAELRQRQSKSVAIPSLTVLDGIMGAVATLDGVERYRGYENDTSVEDANGLPPHSISLVVAGGDAAAIAKTIATKKTPGGGTYGTTTISVTDKYGIVHPISFFRPTSVDIFARVEIKALQGYTSAVGEEIRTAVAAYINEIEIGDPVYLTRLFLPVNLNGSADSATFDITDLQIGTSPGSLAPANVIIGFNAAAACSPDNIVVVVV
ncbi:baseplate J/gp47 family protein [Serratia marcescens]|uniref:baseplate J/gp47 family protein n=1 Tax=Serratia marcescens TaxID=615 RepID=UPI001F4E4823|nr:baseplate J/gp47 family protein [Serratia marcescens]MCH9865837.1 baseplate J/gp47 family protein [Serratia marcescens]